MNTNTHDILVIGAGMAGLSCASRLAAEGREVALIDKGRGPGGRMAARRAEIDGEKVRFDHGAQYFTARDPAFREAVAAWEEAGAVARWPEAGEDAFVGTPGMNGPVKAMAQAVLVRWSVRAERVKHEDGLWRVETDGESLTARTLLVAIPAEQAAALLGDAAPDLAALAGEVVSEPCWAVMAGFAGRLGIDADTFRGSGPIAWAARNSAKPGRTGGETWVIHAAPSRSRELLDVDKDEAARRLLADFFAAAAAAPQAPVHLAAHRWLYAMPASLARDPARYDAAARIGVAGDWLHSPRVEGAFLSGRALAEGVLAHG
ncbi:NAD(P)/FAD-dependent oxidoreductase [Erythrobacter sp.]|uniref:NAD(P)/FAD-dependent oxidoreductase n=1 Tax=Erythrobacter sp. TaxID=1042 RepID=UPI001425E337|nr:FAD-dependent oxidoreductase [Erythrobacter sp.]QIQ85679.1 MAG: NAD(P)-binding protein [Erythrobacter sp.]